VFHLNDILLGSSIMRSLIFNGSVKKEIMRYFIISFTIHIKKVKINVVFKKKLGLRSNSYSQ